MRVTVIPIVTGEFGTEPEGLVRGLEDESEDELSLFKLQHY